MDLEDITPKGSVVPVHLDPTPLPPADPLVLDDGSESKRQKVVLLIGYGIPEEAARLIVEYDGPLDEVNPS